MECYYHPTRESTDNCAICNKSICKECGLEIAGKVYCKECLEKIVGMGIANNAQETPQPARLNRKEPTFERELNTPEEVQFQTQRVASDSPYNIKDSITYEGGVDSSYEESYQPRESLNQAIQSNQEPIAPQREEPVIPKREEFVPEREEPIIPKREEYVPVQEARNEYDAPQESYIQPPRQAPSQEYIYPDHSYDPEVTPARQSLEDKYERYLDDLYFDEDEVPLNEQLARDEEKYGSLTRYEEPKNPHQRQLTADEELDNRIRAELARREQEKKQKPRRSIHNINRGQEKEPIGAVDIILTIILIIVILIVLFYILYLFILSSTYPTFIDAIYGLADPKTFFSALFK